MPFPLAHPVAILPLRRWCPRYFSLMGLVIGSVTPDAGYAFRQLDLNKFSHSLTGSLLFCVPVGCVAALVVFALRQPLAGTLPAPHRQALEPLCARPRPAWWRIALSVFIGAWTHILFDALTHESAFVAYGAEPFEKVASTMRSKEFYQVLWSGVSLLSLGILGWAYARFLRQSTGSFRLLDLSDRRPLRLWLGLLTVPYLVVALFCYRLFEAGGPVLNKHTIYRTFQPYLLLLTGTILVLGLVRLVRHRRLPPRC
jgi:hypothetical protein